MCKVNQIINWGPSDNQEAEKGEFGWSNPCGATWRNPIFDLAFCPMTMYDEFCNNCGRDRSGHHEIWLCTKCNSSNSPSATQCCQCGLDQEERWICVCDHWNKAKDDLCNNCSRHRDTGDWVCNNCDAKHVNVFNGSEKTSIQCGECTAFLPGRWHCPMCSRWHEDGYGVWCKCGFDPETKVSLQFCSCF